MQFLSKPQQDFFIDVDKVILKCTWIGRKEKEKKNCQNHFENEE